MKFLLNLQVTIDGADILSQQNLQGAMLALGASDDADVIKKFAENIVKDVEVATKRFDNVVVSDAEIKMIEEQPQQEQQMQQQEQEYPPYQEDSTPDEELTTQYDITPEQLQVYADLMNAQLERESHANEVVPDEEQIANSDGADEYLNTYYDNGKNIDNSKVENNNQDDLETIEVEPEGNESVQEMTELANLVSSYLFEINSMMGELESIVVARDKDADELITKFDNLNSDNVIVRPDLEGKLLIRYTDYDGRLSEVFV